MYIIEMPSDKTLAELAAMVQWCKLFCHDSYYYFEPNEYLDENAKFWFEDQNDVISFKLRFM